MASLYDDISPQSSIKAENDEKMMVDSNLGKNKLNLAFLKSQLDAKKAALQTQKLSISSSSINVVTPPITNVFSNSTQEKPKSLLNLKPKRALPLSLDSTSTFTIVPKSLKEDKLQKAKERAAKEIAEKLQKQIDEEDSKRKTGAAIAPPQQLLEEKTSTSIPNKDSEFAAPRQFGKAGSRGLGVAANIMQKLGYQEGAGLGRFGQGINQALKVERTGHNQGLIINNSEKEEIPKKIFKGDSDTSITQNYPASDDTSIQANVNITEVLKSATKIVLLKNMAHPSDIDTELEAEIREEMKNYGQLVNVILHQIPNKPDDEAVRIFLEFSNQAQAIKAFVGNNGRFFAGRVVKASFYPLDDYVQRNLNLNPLA